MLNVRKMIDLAKEYGFDVVDDDSNESGFFRKTPEGSIKVGINELINICIPETIDLPDFIWEGSEKIISNHNQKLKTDCLLGVALLE